MPTLALCIFQPETDQASFLGQCGERRGQRRGRDKARARPGEGMREVRGIMHIQTCRIMHIANLGITHVLPPETHQANFLGHCGERQKTRVGVSALGLPEGMC